MDIKEFEKLLKEQHNSMVKTFQEYRNELLDNYERIKDNYPNPNEKLVERMMKLIENYYGCHDIIRDALWALLREAVPIEE